MQHPRRTGFDAHDVEVGASGATAVSVHVSVSVPVSVAVSLTVTVSVSVAVSAPDALLPLSACPMPCPARRHSEKTRPSRNLERTRPHQRRSSEGGWVEGY